MTDRQTDQAVAQSSDLTRYLIVGVLVIASFFGAYRYAAAGNSTAASNTGGFLAAAQGGAAGGGGGCCGGGGGAPVEGVATVAGDVQKINVDVSRGYSPNVIKLKAGVPAEITFGQGGGCTAEVVSADLGFQEDLTGGPKTVKIEALQPGTYGFSCGMGMVTGQVVVL